MVSEIIELIDKTIDHRTEPESVTGYISRNFPPNFEEALARLDEYAIRHRVSIPPILTSIALLRDRGYFKKMAPRHGALAEAARMTQNRLLTPNYQGSLVANQLVPAISSSLSRFPPGG